MRAILVVFAAAQLQGCLFFFAVPTSIFDSANACVGEDAYVGRKLTNPQTGKRGTVKELKGRSNRCQDGSKPILAVVEYE